MSREEIRREVEEAYSKDKRKYKGVQLPAVQRVGTMTQQALAAGFALKQPLTM